MPLHSKSRGAAAVLLALVTAGGAFGVTRLQIDGDLLCALPADDPGVKLLRELDGRFGVLNTMLVGVAAPELFSAPALEALRAITRAAQKLQGVAHAQSITEVLDVETNAEGSTIAPLIKKIPADKRALLALRTKVLTRDGVAGNLVSQRGDAALVVVSLVPGQGSAATASAVRAAALAHKGPLDVHFVGAPATQAFIAREAPRYAAIFVPLALLLFVAVLLLAAPRGRRTFALLWLPLASGVVAALMTVALAALVFQPLCNAAALAFVVPLALGAVAGALVAMRGLLAAGPSVAAALLVAAASLAAFAAFPETRLVGSIGAIGAVCALVTSTLFGLALGEKPGLTKDRGSLADPPRATATLALGAIVLTALVAGIVGLTRIAPPASQTGAFGEGDEPRRAERFLAYRFDFGDTQFVSVDGDLTDPLVPRALERLEESLYSSQGVAMVQAVTVAMRLTHSSLSGRRQLPSDGKALKSLWTMLDGNKDIAPLVDRKRTSALVIAQLRPNPGPGTTPERTRAMIAEIVSAHDRVTLFESPVAAADAPRLAKELTRRMRSLVVRFGEKWTEGVEERTLLALRGIDAKALAPIVLAAVDDYFGSDEALVALRAEGEPRETAAPRPHARVATALTTLLLSRAPAKDLEPLLLRELSPATAKEDASQVPKAATFLYERARSAILQSAVGTLAAKLAPSARPRGERGTRYDAELRTILYAAFDRALLEDAPFGSTGARDKAGSELRARSISVMAALIAADDAQRRAFGYGALVALAVALVLTFAWRRSLMASLALAPVVAGTASSLGGLGLVGVSSDPSLLALGVLVLGTGVFAGVVSLGRRGGDEALTRREAAAPLLAASAITVALLASGFTPLLRFGGAAAAGLVVIALAAAFLVGVARKSEKRRSE